VEPSSHLVILAFQALEPAYVTNRQIEAARIAMARHIKRRGKVWINIQIAHLHQACTKNTHGF
jgi:ribosomal protein L16/L10AE